MSSLPAGHGGNLTQLARRSGLRETDILDFSANLNPLGPPPWLAEEISASIPELSRYPDPDSDRLREAAAAHWGVPIASIVCSNGSDELFRILPRALGVRSLVVPIPSYSAYASSSLPITTIPLEADEGFNVDFDRLDKALQTAGPGGMVFLGAPNNPTGLLPESVNIRNLALRHSASWVCVDEAFLDFTDLRATLALNGPPNLIALRSLTKFWAVPGLRIGLALCSPKVRDRIRSCLSDWPVNTLAETVGTRALGDRSYMAKGIAECARLRLDLLGRLASLEGIFPIPGAVANFLLLRLEKQGFDSEMVENAMLKEGVAVRDCSNFAGLSRDGKCSYLRVAVRTEAENERLVSALRQVLHKLGGGQR
jgi:histidinol-phosphate/aromatic aminotransferase/cobyric acid decarboxylase-like protein